MPTEPPRRVDAHHHVWDLAVRDQPWTRPLPALRRSFALDELLPLLDERRVDATVLVQTVCVAEETPELLRLAARQPRVAGVVGWVDLTAPDVEARLAALRAGTGGTRLVGIRHQVQEEADPDWLARADVHAALDATARAGLAYDLLVTESQLPAAVDAARALPGLRFVLDHAGNPVVGARPDAGWLAAITALGGLANVAVKLSGLLTRAYPRRLRPDELRPYVDTLLGAFGPERVMFGSDWPVCLLCASYPEVGDAAELLTAGLGDAERADVFGGTAERWYGLAR